MKQIFLYIILSIIIFPFSISYSNEKENIGSMVNNNLDEYNKIIKKVSKKSMFFTKEEISKIEKIRSSLMEGVEISQIEVPQNDKVEEKVIVRTKSFYLESILYTNSRNWAIWLNGNKITRENNKGEIEILDIRKNYVRFKWVTAYDRFVNVITNSYNQGLVPANSFVDIRDDIATIIFTLRANQLFEIGDTIIIKEGKLRK